MKKLRQEKGLGTSEDPCAVKGPAAVQMIIDTVEKGPSREAVEDGLEANDSLEAVEDGSDMASSYDIIIAVPFHVLKHFFHLPLLRGPHHIIFLAFVLHLHVSDNS